MSGSESAIGVSAVSSSSSDDADKTVRPVASSGLVCGGPRGTSSGRRTTSSLIDGLSTQKGLDAITLVNLPVRHMCMGVPAPFCPTGPTGLDGLKGNRSKNGFLVMATAMFHASVPVASGGGVIKSKKCPKHMTFVAQDNLCFSTLDRKIQNVLYDLMRNEMTPEEIVTNIAGAFPPRGLSGRMESKRQEVVELKKKLKDEIDKCNQEISKINVCALKAASKPPLTTKCSECKVLGHNITTCPIKKSEAEMNKAMAETKMSSIVELSKLVNDFKCSFGRNITVAKQRIDQIKDETILALNDPNVSVPQKISRIFNLNVMVRRLSIQMFGEITGFFNLLNPTDLTKTQQMSSHDEFFSFSPTKSYIPCKRFDITQNDFKGVPFTSNEPEHYLYFKFNLVVNLIWENVSYDATLNVNMQELMDPHHHPQLVIMEEMVQLLMHRRLQDRVVGLMCDKFSSLKSHQPQLLELVHGSMADPCENWDVMFYESGCSNLKLLNGIRDVGSTLLSVPSWTRDERDIPLVANHAANVAWLAKRYDDTSFAPACFAKPVETVVLARPPLRPLSETRKQGRKFMENEWRKASLTKKNTGTQFHAKKRSSVVDNMKWNRVKSSSYRPPLKRSASVIITPKASLLVHNIPSAFAAAVPPAITTVSFRGDSFQGRLPWSATPARPKGNIPFSFLHVKDVGTDRTESEPDDVHDDLTDVGFSSEHPDNEHELDPSDLKGKGGKRRTRRMRRIRRTATRKTH